MVTRNAESRAHGLTLDLRLLHFLLWHRSSHMVECRSFLMPRRNARSNGSGGALRHLHLRLRTVLWLAGMIVMLPVAIGVGAKLNSLTEIERLRTAKVELETENNSYRAATGELTAQIQSLESVVNELGTRSAFDPAQVRAMQKLPAVVRSRASGGSTTPKSSL